MRTPEQKMRAMIAERTTEELCCDYEVAALLTMDMSVAITMDMMMEELQERNGDAYDKWFNTEDIDLIDCPSHFFFATA